jgi:signal transduction histidine kinase
VLARLEQGNLVSEREPVLLQRVLPRVVDQERRRQPDRDIRLHLSDDLSAVFGDPLYIEQVVSNLLSNALKYSAADQPVDVAAIEVDSGIEIRVRDRGIGMSSHERERAFDLMYRAGAAADLAPGAGVGLYVCRRLLDAMGGTISVEAAPEAGTVFTVRLPVSPD